MQGIPVPTKSVKPIIAPIKIKNLLNLIPDICKYSKEAQFVISKATELFIQFHAEKAIEISSKLNATQHENNNEDDDINDHSQISISGQHCFDAMQTDHKFNFLRAVTVKPSNISKNKRKKSTTKRGVKRKLNSTEPPKPTSVNSSKPQKPKSPKKKRKLNNNNDSEKTDNSESTVICMNGDYAKTSTTATTPTTTTTATTTQPTHLTYNNYMNNGYTTNGGYPANYYQHQYYQHHQQPQQPQQQQPQSQQTQPQPQQQQQPQAQPQPQPQPQTQPQTQTQQLSHTFPSLPTISPIGPYQQPPPTPFQPTTFYNHPHQLNPIPTNTSHHTLNGSSQVGKVVDVRQIFGSD